MTYNKDVAEAFKKIEKLYLELVPEVDIRYEIKSTYGFGDKFVTKSLEQIKQREENEKKRMVTH